MITLTVNMIIKMIKILLCLVLTIPAYAIESSTPCKKSSQYLLEGSPAPCNGHLFSPVLARKMMFQDQSYQDLEKLVERQRKVIDILNTRVTEAQTFGTDLYTEIERRQRYDFWEKTLYFALGVVVTGAIVVSLK